MIFSPILNVTSVQKHIPIEYTYFPYVFFAILYIALGLYPFIAH